jgi:hypothetical protein
LPETNTFEMRPEADLSASPGGARKSGGANVPAPLLALEDDEAVRRSVLVFAATPLVSRGAPLEQAAISNASAAMARVRVVMHVIIHVKDAKEADP